MIDWNDIVVRGTAWLSFAGYCLAAAAWLRGTPASLIRCFWAAGCVIFLIHLAFSFHLVHRWSHQSAWQAAEDQSGFGNGVYLSYLFTLVWLVDALWWLMKPTSYLRRSRWISVPVHGFLLFLWFNGAVVFAKDGMAWFGGACFLALGWLLWRRWAAGRKAGQPG